jgi:hypothetical protein
LAAQGLEEPSVVPPQEVKVSLGQLLMQHTIGE